MRRILLLPVLALATMATSQSASPAKAEDTKLFFGFFMKSDGKLPEDKDATTKLGQAHIGNLQKQFKEKKLIAAGPLQDPTKQRRGVVVLTVKDAKEIPGLFKEDPFVQMNVMTMDAKPWTADRKGINVEAIDPEAIEENRIVVVTAKRTLSAKERTELDRHVANLVKKGIGGWVGKPGEKGIYLFQGKEDDTLKATFAESPLAKSGRVEVEIFPLWMGKGTLTPRS